MKGVQESLIQHLYYETWSKINRVIVAGLLERLEPRDTANGSVLYQGQIRDPSGVQYFSVGDYASESMRELTLQLSPRVKAVNQFSS